MAWYGGTLGRPMRKLRVDECAAVLNVGAFVREHAPGLAALPLVFRVVWTERDTLDFRRLSVEASWRASILPPDWPWRVELDPQPSPLFRHRWWFRCGRCVRRCGIVYAPQPGRPLWCRVCHRLTYATCQRWETLARTGRFPGRLGRIAASMADPGNGTSEA